MKLKLLTVTAAISLSGCMATAPKDGNCTKSNSEGLCLLDLVGISKGASDIRRSDLKAANVDLKALNNTSSININGDFLIAAGLERISPTSIPGLGGGTPGNVFLLASVLKGKDIGQLANMFAIIPNSEVVGGNPKTTVQTHVINAFAAQLGAKLDPKPTVTTRKYVFGQDAVLLYRMSGGRCGTEGCYASVDFSQLTGTKDTSFQTIDALPAWYGSGKAHVVLNTLPTAFRDPNKPFNSLVSTRADTLGAMARLPKWLYYYEPGNPSVVLSSDKVRVLVKPN